MICTSNQVALAGVKQWPRVTRVKESPPLALDDSKLTRGSSSSSISSTLAYSHRYKFAIFAVILTPTGAVLSSIICNALFSVSEKHDEHATTTENPGQHALREIHENFPFHPKSKRAHCRPLEFKQAGQGCMEAVWYSIAGEVCCWWS